MFRYFDHCAFEPADFRLSRRTQIGNPPDRRGVFPWHVVTSLKRGRGFLLTRILYRSVRNRADARKFGALHYNFRTAPQRTKRCGLFAERPRKVSAFCDANHVQMRLPRVGASKGRAMEDTPWMQFERRRERITFGKKPSVAEVAERKAVVSDRAWLVETAQHWLDMASRQKPLSNLQVTSRRSIDPSVERRGLTTEVCRTAVHDCGGVQPCSMEVNLRFGNFRCDGHHTGQPAPGIRFS